MAEWTGPRHRKRGSAIDIAAAPLPPDAPEAPGAVHSPQQPGRVPDRSTIPGKFSIHVAAAPNARRPLTEYETAQRIMGVFTVPPGERMEPARFEQATASFEEIRKADPAQLPPLRPAPGYLLQPTAEIRELNTGPESTEIAPE